MPYLLRKVPRRNCWRVSNRRKKRVYSKCATRKNARAQLRLLRAIENSDWRPTGRRSRRSISSRRR